MPITPDHTWDELFGELYFRAYEGLHERDSESEALAAAALAGVEAPAEIIDAPTGFGRHAIPLAKNGFRVTGVDRSEVQLAEARRAAGDVEWPKWMQGDVRELPVDESSFDAALCLFTSIGYGGEHGDRAAFAEFLRVLRPGGRLVLESLHRDRLSSIFHDRRWDRLSDDAVRLEERRFDLVSGEIETDLTVLSVGERRSVTYRLRIYTATELVKLLAEIGFVEIECFGDLGGGPLTRETRLVVSGRRPG